VTDWHRISFNVVAGGSTEKAISKIPKGLRSMIIRSLLEKAVETANEEGSLVYGIIIDGLFNISYMEPDR